MDVTGGGKQVAAVITVGFPSLVVVYVLTQLLCGRQVEAVDTKIFPSLVAVKVFTQLGVGLQSVTVVTNRFPSLDIVKVLMQLDAGGEIPVEDFTPGMLDVGCTVVNVVTMVFPLVVCVTVPVEGGGTRLEEP